MPEPFSFLMLVVLGLLLGSFATALVYRAPRGIPWAYESSRENTEQGARAYRSVCPHCQMVLAPRDLIPLFSWLLQKGRCRGCNTAIGWIYPLVEMATVLAVVGAALMLGWQLKLIFVIAAVPFLVALFFIDFEHMILPDTLLLPLLILGAGYQTTMLAHSGFEPTVMALTFAVAPIFYGGTIWFLSSAVSNILKREALGFGDVKFFAVAGLWLGLSPFALFCMFSGLVGVAIGIIWNLAGRGRVYPFGPALILSFYALLLLPLARCGVCALFLLE